MFASPGEYRDRLIVTNPDLRLYTRALNIFTELQVQTRMRGLTHVFERSTPFCFLLLHLGYIFLASSLFLCVFFAPSRSLFPRARVPACLVKLRIQASAPKFKDPAFVDGLAVQMEQLRGRELPGFMSAQSFYMFIQEYIDKWKAPARLAVGQLRVLALEVSVHRWRCLRES